MTQSPAIIVAALLVMAAPLLAAEIPQGQRRSGFSFMAPETQAMQNDDAANPGMLWVLDGEKLWNGKTGAADKACADCHNDARVSMKGVAARYPVYDKSRGRPVDLEARINLCRAEHQQATPLAYESHDLLALTAFIAQQSRGIEISASRDPALEQRILGEIQARLSPQAVAAPPAPLQPAPWAAPAP